MNLVVGNVNSRQKWKNNKCQCESKKSINFSQVTRIMPGILVQLLPSFTIIMRLANTWKTAKVSLMVVTCDEIEDTQKTVVVNPSNGIDYRLIVVVLLAIACLLLLVAIDVKYYMKRGLTTPCLLSH